MVTAGIAGLVAEPCPWPPGEYVSVSSQRDAEQADIAVETRELRQDPRASCASS
jgi:VIT1/CCC1 family predicted Fe2+/Mn2+ transporter